MAVNRKHFRDKLRKMPQWHCPRCDSGVLQEVADKRVQDWPLWSKFEKDEDWWEPEHATYRFATLMRCNNSLCGESVFVTGELSAVHLGDDEDGSHWMDMLDPRTAFPTIPVFKIRDDWPAALIEELQLSFGAIWNDAGSAANHLRIAVERLLDHLGVKKTTLVAKGGKKRRLRLPTHDRIVAFRKTNPKAAALLEAVKWLGNAGSHADLTGLSRSDVLDGMEIMEHVLHELFDTTTAKVLKLAKGINKKKGPVAGKKAKAPKA